jgi:hypothetical protein
MAKNAAVEIKQTEERYENFKYHVIGYFETADLGRLGGKKSCDLITDLNGVLYYTTAFGKALKRYLSMLKIGGFLYFTRSPARFLITRRPELNEEQTVDEWLRNITGVKTEVLKNGAFRLSRLREEIVVPALELVETSREGGDTGNAVCRVYRCTLH